MVAYKRKLHCLHCLQSYPQPHQAHHSVWQPYEDIHEITRLVMTICESCLVEAPDLIWEEQSKNNKANAICFKE